MNIPGLKERNWFRFLNLNPTWHEMVYLYGKYYPPDEDTAIEHLNWLRKEICNDRDCGAYICRILYDNIYERPENTGVKLENEHDKFHNNIDDELHGKTYRRFKNCVELWNMAGLNTERILFTGIGRHYLHDLEKRFPDDPYLKYPLVKRFISHINRESLEIEMIFGDPTKWIDLWDRVIDFLTGSQTI